MLVQGVAGESGGLGYFGHSYYEQNKDKLNLVKVDGGGGCIEPTTETIQSGEYKPLSRPLFMYPSTKALKRPEVEGVPPVRRRQLPGHRRRLADRRDELRPGQQGQADLKADIGG